jgi:putative ABC transport system substrate-binding protein
MANRGVTTARALFVAVLGLALLGLPFAALAQAPSGKVYRIGWLHPLPILPGWEEAFHHGLRKLGYAEGQNVVIERLWSGGLDRLPAGAAHLVQLNVDVLIAGNSRAVQALKAATKSIPIVMTGTNDPVGTGLIASLGRPGGNVTGLSGLGTDLSAKRLELLREAIPGVTRVTMLSNMGNPSIALQVQEMQQAAKVLGISFHNVDVRDAGKIDVALASALQARPDGIVLPPETVVHSEQARARIAEFGIKHRIPTMGSWREFTDSGGLLVYGASVPDIFRRAAGYVDKIFKGAKAADLPVEEPRKFELILNLKTARALGLTIPPTVRARVDEVIE